MLYVTSQAIRKRPNQNSHTNRSEGEKPEVPEQNGQEYAQKGREDQYEFIGSLLNLIDVYPLGFAAFQAGELEVRAEVLFELYAVGCHGADGNFFVAGFAGGVFGGH